MSNTSLVEPTLELVRELAGTLCLSDVKECISRGFKSPIEALESVFNSGEMLGIGCVDGKPVMAIGVMRCNVLNPYLNQGFLWLVANEEMRKHPRAVIAYSQKVVKFLLSYLDVLISQVSDERSLRYNKFLGFQETGIFQGSGDKQCQYLINYGI